MKTILIVDDEAFFSESIQSAFNQSEYKIITALDGEQGLRMIQEFKPDAVLLDITMPGMNGLEVLKKIDTKKIPVMITSNMSDKKIIGEAMTLGAKGYIIKSNELPKSIAENIKHLFVTRKPEIKVA